MPLRLGWAQLLLTVLHTTEQHCRLIENIVEHREWQSMSQLKGGEIAREIQEKTLKCFFLITDPSQSLLTDSLGREEVARL